MDEKQSLIVACVRDGQTIEQAAQEADVPIGTVRRWLTEGRKRQSGSWAVFARSVDAFRQTVPEAVTGDRFTEIEAVAEIIGDQDPAALARLGLARALARKIDWCEATPSGAAAMALANLSKQYREVLDEVQPHSSEDFQALVGALTSGQYEYHFEEALERIANGKLSTDDSATEAAEALERVREWKAQEAEGTRNSIFAEPGNYENLNS